MPRKGAVKKRSQVKARLGSSRPPMKSPGFEAGQSDRRISSLIGNVRRLFPAPHSVGSEGYTGTKIGNNRQYFSVDAAPLIPVAPAVEATPVRGWAWGRFVHQQRRLPLWIGAACVPEYRSQILAQTSKKGWHTVPARHQPQVGRAAARPPGAIDQ